MEKIEITDKLILDVANAEFNYQRQQLLPDMPLNVRESWRDGAIKMLLDYNRIVEILTTKT